MNLPATLKRAPHKDRDTDILISSARYGASMAIPVSNRNLRTGSSAVDYPARPEEAGVRAEIRGHLQPFGRRQPDPAGLLMEAIAAFGTRLTECQPTIDTRGRICLDPARAHHAAHQPMPAPQLRPRRPKSIRSCHRSPANFSSELSPNA
jgi:hypothetical protein